MADKWKNIPDNYRPHHTTLDKEYRKALQADPIKWQAYDEYIEKLKPIYNKAVKKAEGNKNNFGVIGAKTPEEAERILNQSIRNNFVRWMQAETPGNYVDFFANRWAPIGVDNDPKNLNKNWTGNVRDSIKKQVGEEKYKELDALNLVIQKAAKKEYEAMV